VLEEQQRIADAFYELKLIPRKIVTKQAVLA
jgi:sulfonate transport system substrate-binding protein